MGKRKHTFSCYICRDRMLPAIIRSQISILKYYFRLGNISSNSIVKNIFLELYKLCSLVVETWNWVSNVKSIFQNHSMLHYLNMENVSEVEIDDCLDLLKSSLCKSFQVQCMQDVNQKPILRTYCLHKTVTHSLSDQGCIPTMLKLLLLKVYIQSFLYSRVQ